MTQTVVSPPPPAVSVFFLARSLEAGGAERQLIALADGLARWHVEVRLACFYPGGALWRDAAAVLGDRLISLGKRGRWDVLHFGRELLRQIRASAPDVIYGWLGVPNVVALAAGRVTGLPVVWGIRSADMDLTKYDWLSRLEFRLGAALSDAPQAVVFNSWAGLTHYRAAGYRNRLMTVVPNGIDTRMFRPDAAVGGVSRARWRRRPEDRVVGLVARIDPVKGHEVFLRAAARVASCVDNVVFVCVGDGPTQAAAELRRLTGQLAIDDRVVWVPESSDMNSVYNALDVLVLSSASEGFPNVIGEAMACGVPCITTDVGDARRIVDDTGLVVPPRDGDALAEAVLRALSPGWAESKRDLARRRIDTVFGLEPMIQGHLQVLRQVIAVR